ADELVPDREPRLNRHSPMEDVQIGAADPARLDPHHRIVGGNQLRVGLLLDPNLPGRLKCDGTHSAEPYRSSADGPKIRLYGVKSARRRAVLADGDVRGAEAVAVAEGVGGLFDPR